MHAATIPTRPAPTRRVATTAWRAPFASETWRRTAYALLAFPVGVVSIPVSLVGGPADRLQRGLAMRLLVPQVATPTRKRAAALAHAVVATPVNLAAMLVTGYGWSIVVLNLAYPARPLVGLDAGGDGAWGGPTLAGAWVFHAVAGGLVFLLAMPWIVKGLTSMQERLLHSLLG